MKVVKLAILALGLFAFTSVNAQNSKEKAEKKLGWMDKDKNNSISKEEMIAFYEGKKNKKGKVIDGEKLFIGTDHNNDGSVTVEELQQKVNWKKVNKGKSTAKSRVKTQVKKEVKTAKVNKKGKLPEGKDEKRLYWMDQNKNGSVSLEEMIDFFKGKKDKKGNPRNGEEIFIGTDANDDGKVTLEELKKGVDWKKVNAKKNKSK